MRLSLISVCGFLAVFSGVASAKLPTVNVSGDGVSARSAFGDTETVRGTVSYAPAKRVVSRGANRKASGVEYNAKNADVLSPNLPSSNLWAATPEITTPLRMPDISEVAVLNNESELPDEILDFAFDNRTVEKSAPVTRTEVARDLEKTMNRMAEIDAQIAKLSELQRRANDSVQNHNALRQNVVAMDDNHDVKISRAVVPMDEPEVLIRSVETHNVANRAAKKEPTQKSYDSLAGLSPTELRKAFRKTFLSENKHLSAMRDAYADEYDTTSVTTGVAGFTAETNLSEMGGGIRPFEIKISFRNADSSLSRENYTLLTTFAGIVVNDPKRAVQVLIPNDATTDSDNRKLTARRLAIVEQVLRDTGVPEQRIMPVLSNREDDGGLVLRNIDSTQYETLTKQQRNQFGKTTNKTYKSMTW